MKYQRPDRLLIGGCSFSAGSSTVHDIINAEAKVWPDFLVIKYGINIINNHAIPGGGNLAMVQNLAYAISRSDTSFPPEKTLVLFNITGLERIDLMVSGNHPDINTFSSWNGLLPFSWITSGGWFGPQHLKGPRWPTIGYRSGHAKSLIDSLQKNQEYEQVVLNNCLTLVNFIESLRARQYRYNFMIMDDQVLIDAPSWFGDFIENDSGWIKFDQHRSMYAFAKSCEGLQDDNFHPNAEGHEKIAAKIGLACDHHFI